MAGAAIPIMRAYMQYILCSIKLTSYYEALFEDSEKHKTARMIKNIPKSCDLVTFSLKIFENKNTLKTLAKETKVDMMP